MVYFLLNHLTTSIHLFFNQQINFGRVMSNFNAGRFYLSFPGLVPFS
jgi:hypothetical protein